MQAAPPSQEISITRALANLKLLGKRIEKPTTGAQFLQLITKTNKHTINEEHFRASAKATYQSVNDLIEQHHRIKSAIIRSNATTMVRVGKGEYTIAEVIERRKSLPMQKTMLESLRRERESVNRSFEAQNKSIETDLQSMLEKAYSSNTDKANIEIISTEFRKSREVRILDPIGIDAEIARLSEYIENFDSEANLVLSESNAKTLITV